MYDKIDYVTHSDEKWVISDVLVDDSPSELRKKPENKISIKVNTGYNKDSDSDFSVMGLKNLTDELFRKSVDLFIEKNI